MAKTAAWHSKCDANAPYHDDDRCTEGNNIESYCRAPGDGGRRKCKNCVELSG